LNIPGESILYKINTWAKV